MNSRFSGLIAMVSPFASGCLGDPPPGVTDAELQALTDRVDELSADHEALTEENQALEARITELETLALQQAADNESRMSETSALDARMTVIEGAAVLLISEDTTFTVGAMGDYAGLPEALAALDHYRIATGVTVTLQLEAGTYTFDEALEIQHPDGDRIAILGDVDDPSTTVLEFNGTDGILVVQNHALGRLDGVTVEQMETGVGRGIATDHGGSAIIGDTASTHVVVRGWGIGLSAKRGSNLFAIGNEVSGLVVEDCTSGIQALYGSSINADYADVSRAENGIGAGFESFVSAAATRVSSSTDGISVTLTSTVYAYKASISDSSSRALVAVWNSMLYASAANLDEGAVVASGESYVDVDDAEEVGTIATYDGGSVDGP